MGRRVWGVVSVCAVTMTVLSSCAGGTLNAPDSGGTGPTISTSVTAVTAGQSAAASSAAEQSRRAVAQAHAAAAASSQAAAKQSAEQRSVAEDSAAQQTSAEALDDSAAQDPATQARETPDSANSAEQDALTHGWYDERGWISPETAARAMAAGIAPGKNVPDYLRCGTICGEDPTSGEIQAQKSAEEQSAGAQSTDTSAPCAYMVVRGVCYTTPAEASAAGD